MRFWLTLGIAVSLSAGRPHSSVTLLGKGQLPVITADSRGTIHLVFGREDTLFYASSADLGKTFSKPLAVTRLPELVLIATRGPQIAAGDKQLLITASDKAGNVWAWSRPRRGGEWSHAVRINDQPDIGREGFQAVTALSDNRFFAAWLDLRGNKRNKIVGALSVDGGRTWNPNQLIYQSPDETVCECCRVSVAASGNNIAVLFRNWLNGSRDLYLSQSRNGGQSFSSAEKLGLGTWKLNACPMDGGGLAVTGPASFLTAWRRESSLYLCRPGQPEALLGPGRQVALAADKKHWVAAFQQGGSIRLQTDLGEATEFGPGQTPSVTISRGEAICVWENERSISTAVLPLH
ncbi:sialidase family protein [Siphonobacter aquaeclarae]|uniref:BNR repeat-like domain-containing protein n=1 Tax=Siphonobacter aquaeclarae TaxID=563176 RepID=A0A1G9PEM5_9BACT|nr:sialidase family protein [Siphonobacter aquaeclarae]SDL97276.1 BNR repeat-like domain-containing protein [Siphonobacter aquaeclarae]